jgi:hypothetical protein
MDAVEKGLKRKFSIIPLATERSRSIPLFNEPPDMRPVHNYASNCGVRSALAVIRPSAVYSIMHRYLICISIV